METLAGQLAVFTAAGAAIGALAGLTWGLWMARHILARSRMLKHQAEVQCERMRQRWLDEDAYAKALRRHHADEIAALVRLIPPEGQ